VDLRQTWSRPTKPRPIVIIGAGGIVNDAHLPAYRLAEFPVAGLFDIDRARAEALAAKWGLKVFSSLEEAAAVKDAAFDLAIPPAAQRFMAKRAKAHTTEVAASHASYLSHPREVTDVILRAARSVR